MSGRRTYNWEILEKQLKEKLQEYIFKEGYSNSMKKPPKWTEVYPQGTEEGNQEQHFFRALSRNKDKRFRSVNELAKKTKLAPERVEEIIIKYHALGLVFQNPKNDDEWGYWERCIELLNKDERTISEKDKSQRINKVIKKSPW
jgi:hypothetical protein